MTTEHNRKLTPVSTQAHAHMEKIVAAYKKRGLPESNTHWLSELILSQSIPNGNRAHYVGDAKPVRKRVEAAGINELPDLPHQ